MDGDDEKLSREKKFPKKQTTASGGGRPKESSAVEDEGVASLRRAFLVEKWMDMKPINSKNKTHRTKPSSLPDFDQKPVLDNDQFFFLFNWGGLGFTFVITDSFDFDFIV